jgi:hypothetical protein
MTQAEPKLAATTLALALGAAFTALPAVARQWAAVRPQTPVHHAPGPAQRERL